MFHVYVMNQQMHSYRYVQSHGIIFHQKLSVTQFTIIRVSYNKNTINMLVSVHGTPKLHYEMCVCE